MTIEELKIKKQELESQIKEMLLKFNRDSGTNILGVGVTPIPSQLSQNSIIDYKIQVGIGI